MSKRSKKNRSAKLAIPSQTAKRGSPRLAVVFVAAAVMLALGFWWWKSRSADLPPTTKPLAGANAANLTSADGNAEFQKLTGRWQRPDGGYIFEVRSVAADGVIDAAYFNPKSIHVANAEASRNGDTIKVLIELRDVNYPGSTYTLTYDPASDLLKGIYYQAAEKQRFEVAFVRMK
jgi:hypothetical protein